MSQHPEVATLDILLVEIAHIIEVVDLNALHTQEHFGEAGNDNQCIVGVLLLYGLAYGGGGYGFADAAIDLENDVHKGSVV